jgi:anti-sigma regulatory factor (Ser/Thr protein kinase)
MTEGSQRLLVPPASGALVELRLWARSWMEQHPTHGVDPDNVVLSMIELVTNSIKHGAGPVDVELTADTDNLLLVVSDCSEEMPRRRGQLTGEAETGRGILILESLATRWGVRPEPSGGKTVWCEFAAR